ncbi:MAG: efflux RND transporter permease subunit [Patescibacteria group bacterium]
MPIDIQNKTEQLSSDSKYLAKLEFNPALRKTWLNFFVSNFRVVVLLIILVSVWGIYSFTKLPRESNPEVKIPIAVVMTAYPGVSPADMEELVTKKLETGISGIKGIKKITSTSANSLSAITVEFEAKQDLDDSIRRLRDKVSTLKNELPADAQDPQVKEISLDDEPIWTISISGPYDGLTMRRYADDIADELEKVSGVREVNVSGGDEVEFEVAYDPQKLIFYNLSPDSVNQAIKATNLAMPAGNFTGNQFNYAIRSDARVFTAEAIGNIPIAHSESGDPVYVKDVAAVKEKTIKRTSYSRLSIEGGQPTDAISLSVVKKTGGNIVETIDESKAAVDQMLKKLPTGIRYDTTIDMAEIIGKQFNQLTHDFILTIILVSVVLFLIVGLKEAFVAGMAVPLTFFITFGVMSAAGITLNFLSIFSLLLSLGLLVDDAIVVVSATKQYLRTGKYTPEEAVLLVLNDFKVVLTTTTLTTVWAFLPLLLSTGIMGEFIKSIPITVSVTLTASLLVALMVNHPLAAVLERIRLTRKFFWLMIVGLFAGGAYTAIRGSWYAYLAAALFVTAGILIRWYYRGGEAVLRNNKNLMEAEADDDELIKKKLREQGTHEDDNWFSRAIHGVIHFNKILPYYEKTLRAILATKKTRRQTIAAVLVLFTIAMSFLVTGIVPTEFFPASNEDTISISIEAPIGLRLEETDKAVVQVERQLLKYKEIENFSTVLGRGGSSSVLSAGGSNSNLASIAVRLVDSKKRTVASYDLASKMRADFKAITGATVTVESPRGGPPSGSAFEARVTGEDLQALDKIAHDLKPILSGIKGVTDSQISLKDAPAEYSFLLEPSKLEMNNLNAAMVGSVLRLAITGTEVSTVIENGKEIKIMARFDERAIPSLESVQNLQVVNKRGQSVFLKDVAKIELKPSVASISRVDQKRTVLLSAGVDGATRPNAVLAEFQQKIKNYKLPDGYAIVYGGENEQNQESVYSILTAMVLAGILIISTLVIQFNSFKKALIVLITIPLALIGVFFGLAVFRISLSFPGLIGLLALFGIVVKNAIILIDKINLNLKFGIPFEEAIVDAGKSRLEAIFITSICTILGLIPVTLSEATWTALGSAVIFGLTLSSFLTLFIVPTLFRMMIGEKERF